MILGMSIIYTLSYKGQRHPSVVWGVEKAGDNHYVLFINTYQDRNMVALSHKVEETEFELGLHTEKRGKLVLRRIRKPEFEALKKVNPLFGGLTFGRLSKDGMEGFRI